MIALAGIAGSLLSSAAKHWRLVAVGLVTASLIAALLLTRSTLAGVKADLGKARTGLASEQVAHDATRASVATLKVQIAAQNADVAARAKALDDARRQAAADVAAADQRWRSTADQVARLKAIASRPAAGCAVPVELARALEGL